MNIISILGLLVLLLITWAISYHKKEIKLRPIFWGIGLQLIFALIILREDYLSFVGMSILCLWILQYIYWDEKKNIQNQLKTAFIIICFSAISSYLLYFISDKISVFIWITIFVLIVNYYTHWISNPIRKHLISLFCILLTSLLINNNLYGKIIFQEFSTKIAFFLSLSDYGAQFLFGNLVEEKYF